MLINWYGLFSPSPSPPPIFLAFSSLSSFSFRLLLFSISLCYSSIYTFLSTVGNINFVKQHIDTMEEMLLLGVWWVGLGVLSSIGLGTGLHTFVLYLGPYIAKVSLNKRGGENERRKKR